MRVTLMIVCLFLIVQVLSNVIGNLMLMNVKTVLLIIV